MLRSQTAPTKEQPLHRALQQVSSPLKISCGNDMGVRRQSRRTDYDSVALITAFGGRVLRSCRKESLQDVS